MTLVENALTPDSYMHLRDAVGWNRFTHEQAQRALSHDGYNVVAYDGSQPVGMGRLVGDGIYYLIVDVVVHPASQKQGIGSAILKRMIEQIESHLSEGERCSVQLVAASEKEPFYEQFGFQTIPNASSGHGMQLFLSK